MTTKRQFELSIIIVTYNNKYYLSKLLKKLSFAPQKWQVIIVDNNSHTPETKRVLNDYKNQPNFTIIFNKKNIGFARAVNQAAQLAKGKYLLLLNPDLFITPDQIKKLLDFARKHQKVGAVAPALISVDNRIQASVYPLPSLWGAIKEFILGFKGNYSPYLPPQNRPTKVPAVVGACLLIPTSVFRRVGGLNSRYFLYFEDLEFCQNLQRLGLSIWYLPHLRIKHYLGESGKRKETTKLLNQSAQLYFGRTKKTVIDLMIRFGHFLPAIVLSLLFALIKLRIITNTSGFAADQEYLAWQAYNAWQKHHFFLTGLPASIGGFFIAPYYSYLNALLFKFWSFNPSALFVTSTISNFFTLVTIYYLGYMITRRRLLAYLLMFTFTVSKYSNGLWPVDWLTLSAVLFLISLWLLYQNKYNQALLWLALSFFIGVSAHPSYLAIIPFGLILGIYLFIKAGFNSRLISTCLASLSLLPLVLFDLKHSGYNLKGVLSIMSDQQNRSDYFQATPIQFIWVSLKNNYLKGLDLPTYIIFVTVGTAFLTLTYFIYRHKKNYLFYLISILISLTLMFGLPFVLTKTVDYYLLYPGIMLFFVTWILILKSSLSFPIIPRWTTLILIFLSLSYLGFTKTSQTMPFSWHYQKKAVNFISQNFDLNRTRLAIITQPGYEKGFYYLFEYFKKKYKNHPKYPAKWVNLVFLSDWHNDNVQHQEFGGYKIYWK